MCVLVFCLLLVFSSDWELLVVILRCLRFNDCCLDWCLLIVLLDSCMHICPTDCEFLFGFLWMVLVYLCGLLFLLVFVCGCGYASCGCLLLLL